MGYREIRRLWGIPRRDRRLTTAAVSRSETDGMQCLRRQLELADEYAVGHAIVVHIE